MFLKNVVLAKSGCMEKTRYVSAELKSFGGAVMKLFYLKLGMVIRQGCSFLLFSCGYREFESHNLKATLKHAGVSGFLAKRKMNSGAGSCA